MVNQVTGAQRRLSNDHEAINSGVHITRPQLGSNLPIDYTFVDEVTRAQNTDHHNRLRIVGDHTEFSCQKATVLLLHTPSLLYLKGNQKRPYAQHLQNLLLCSLVN